MREGKHRKPIHLAAHFPGVNNTTVWSDPESGSQIEFDSFVHLARTAERGLFDFFFLAEGLRLREHRGRIHDLDVVGRPDTFTVLAALAAVTDRVGLTGTINTTFNEPFEVARQFATLDHLSDGRAGWNMVTSSDAFTGENFRRGGFLDYADRYRRAEEFITVARAFWDSWDDDAVRADADAGSMGPAPDRTVEYHGSQFDVRGVATLPVSPQRHPVLLQAGDSSDGRAFGAKHADAMFTLHSALEAGRRYYADVKGRAAAHGRDPDRLKVFPPRRSSSATPRRGRRQSQAHPPPAGQPADGDRDARAGMAARPVRLRPRRPAARRRTGRRPDHHPGPGAPWRPEGRRCEMAGPRAGRKARIRELVIAVTNRQQFVGTPAQIADEIDLHVQSDACDGFILVPHLTPRGLDEFVDRVVPLLQERGAFRTEYAGQTLRDHLGL